MINSLKHRVPTRPYLSGVCTTLLCAGCSTQCGSQHTALTGARHSKLLQCPTASPDAALGLSQLRSRAGKDVRISYPCVMLNVMVAAHNTNDQYADLTDAATHTYKTSSQMSIEFEVDGPYRVCAQWLLLLPDSGLRVRVEVVPQH